MSTYLFLLWSIIFSITGLATLFSIWSRRETWVRTACVGLFLFGFVAVPVVYTETLGQHKPVKLEQWLPDGDYVVLSWKAVQGRAIYIYLDSGRLEPWPLILPWDNRVAQKMQELSQLAPKENMGRFMFSYERSLDTHAPQFHPLPQPPALPPKPRDAPVPHVEEGDA